MRQNPNKAAIGLFLLIGIITLTLIVGHSIFQKFWDDDRYIAVMYFEESVKGLNVGSSVVFNGVEIGKVVKIELVGDAQNLTFQVPVYVRLMPMTKMKKSGWNSFTQEEDVLNVLIQKGLRGRLLTQSYLTGQLMIELGMMPNTPIRLIHSPRDSRQHIPEIPTVLSPTGELSRGIQDLPIRATLEKLDSLLTNLNELVPTLNRTAENLESITGTAAPQTADTIQNANTTLYNISDAMRAVRNLADYLEQYPESLLKGKR